MRRHRRPMRRPPPDAGVPPCTGDIVTVDDFDTNTTIIFDTRLVIGPDGHEHVTFVAQTNPDEILLFHSDRAPASSAGWRTEKVALAQDYLIGQTLDDTGVVHATFAGENGLVYLARRLDFADWTIEPVSTAVAWNSSVAVEASGHIDVVYHTAGTFVHARRTGSGTVWLRNPIETGSTPGQQQSMAISPTGVLTVAYLHRASFSPYELKLGEWAPLGAWQITPLERSGDPGHYPAMAIDEGGSLHIVHGDYQNHTLDYLRLDPDGNRRDLVVFDENAWLGRYNGIAIDRQGNIHVTGEDRDSGRLRHGVLRRDGRAFAMSTVEEVGAIEGRSSIAVAPDGRVFVSYPNARTGHVRVAELCVD
jgi:hypothetical protein